MQLIMRLLGTPTGNVWPVRAPLPYGMPQCRSRPVQPANNVSQGFTQMPSARQVVIPNQPYNYLKKASLHALWFVVAGVALRAMLKNSCVAGVRHAQ